MSSRLSRVVPAARCLVVVIACSAASACGPREEVPTDTTAGAGATAATSTGLGDPQIAHVAVTANAIDSSFGELALTKARSQAVKDFAQTMITDHGGVNRQAVELVQRLGVTPQENDVSRQLQAAADSARNAMSALSGAAFDSAYMAREVVYHQAVIDALDQTLIPGAQNAELKALLEGARPAFNAHLERARQVQGSLRR
jgi:putative membrane protein